MGVPEDDWRRQGQERYLRGVRLKLTRYRARSARWEHEHCDFCWHTFLDPNYSEAQRKVLEEDPDRHSAEGYTNLIAEGGQEPGTWWICKRCFHDFAPEFEWIVVAPDSDVQR